MRAAPRFLLPGQIIFGFALLLALAACSLPPPYQPQSQTPSVPLVADEVVVSAGDNIYTLARANRVPFRDLVAANLLDPPFVLKPGQRLRLPPIATYVVAEGEGLDSIATRLGTNSEAIQRLNPIPPSGVAAGMVLRVPFDRGGNSSLPQGPVSADVAVSELMPRDAQASLSPGLSPSLSSAVGTSSFGSVPVTTEALPHAEPKMVLQQGMPPAAVNGAPPAAVSPVAVPATTAMVVPNVPANKDVTTAKPEISFRWPLQGQILSSFGQKAGGTRNDGINIAAPRGTPVQAAKGGVVVYAGSELKGFGNLVLLRHEQGWITAYGHLQQMLVAKDDILAEGDVLGTVGDSGGAGQTQLHFEVRSGTTPVDPKLYLVSGR